MNFFKLYIGDYQRDTASLSVTEHGAYLLMLQHFYATEKPLPVGKALHRMLRAETKGEREAIDCIAAKFWTPVEAGIVNERAAEEMQKAEHQRTVNREIGKLGGRPKKTESQTESVAAKNPVSKTDSLTDSLANRNPNQTPDTRHQNQEAKTKAVAEPAFVLPDWIPVDVWEAWMPVRKAKRAANTPFALRLIVKDLARWRDAGHDPAAILQSSIRGGWSDVYEPKPGQVRHMAPADRRAATVAAFVAQGELHEAD